MANNTLFREEATRHLQQDSQDKLLITFSPWNILFSATCWLGLGILLLCLLQLKN